MKGGDNILAVHAPIKHYLRNNRILDPFIRLCSILISVSPDVDIYLQIGVLCIYDKTLV